MEPDPDSIRRFIEYAGFGLAGDIGPFTCWTTRTGKLVVATRTPPTKPPSNKQQRQRNRFALALQNWRLQTPLIQQQWELLAQRVGVIATGLNCWIHLSLIPNDDALAAANATSGLNLTPPPPIDV